MLPFRVPWTNFGDDDDYGRSLILKIGNARQVFRWIPPGHFLMGSPADEAQRSNSERQHEVRLSYGYWLADTACTQEFWLAVWPVNPSHFDACRQNPVENV
ncbi:MAG TPA: formylglycine-generating enzyme family protein, partial [Accumulibacter sp.]|nr:formylglycine-generating enzyme family protein [Accumulibacter sp.]